MAIDSEMDRQRVKYKKNLHLSKLFQELACLAADTSTPTLPCVMKQARYGSARIMAGFSLEESMSYIQQAKQMMEVLPACFETGTVLYIEFNAQLHIYQHNKLPIDKQRMSMLGNRAIEHFAAEEQQIGDDFKRIFMLKIAYTKLGMGVFLDFLDSKESITDDLVKEADKLIKTVKDQYWSRMERRAKMVYYSTKSRIMQIKEKPLMSIQLSELSLKCAKRGHFEKEKSSIERNITVLKREYRTRVHLSPGELPVQ